MEKKWRGKRARILKELEDNPLVERACKKFAQYVASKLEVEVGKVGKHKAVLHNVKIDDSVFSGRVLYFSANWIV